MRTKGSNVTPKPLLGLFYNAQKEGYRPSFGGSTAFLLWNGLMCVFEALMSDWRICVWIKDSLPRPMRTFLVVMLALPVAHWFCDPYVQSNFFQHGQLAFFMIRCRHE